MKDNHPGFEKIAARIARKEHVPLDEARAMLAASTRRDSERARRNNPRLDRVKK